MLEAFQTAGTQIQEIRKNQKGFAQLLDPMTCDDCVQSALCDIDPFLLSAVFIVVVMVRWD